MEKSLMKGDYVIVNKFRVSNSFLKRNDIVLFNSQSASDRENARPSLLLSRCVAMPGDTVLVRDDGYVINGRKYPCPPTVLFTYTVSKSIKSRFLNILKQLDIPQREPADNPDSMNLKLTLFEEYQIREELTPGMNANFVRPSAKPYIIVVPRKGITYHINKHLIASCRDAISKETDGRAAFTDDAMYINDEEVKTFKFRQNYYWLLSDNINESVDSRHVGFVPHSHIVGKVWFRWHSIAP
jgi:signal peptidase I